MQLRPYQQDAIKHLRQGFAAGNHRQVLQLATGGGKTHIAAQIVDNACDKGNRVWFVVDNLELVQQTIDVFEKHGHSVGVIQGIHEKTDYAKDIQVATAQTINRRWHILDKMDIYHPSFFLIDEAHCIYKAHHEIVQRFPQAPVIGLSATPWAKGMRDIYSNLVVGATTRQLIEQGHLCEYEAYAPYTPDLKGVKIQAGDYKPDQLVERLSTNEICGNVVDTWLRLGEGRQTIVFAVNIAHSKALTKAFQEKGVNAQHLDGWTDKTERKQVIEDFKRGAINVLVSVGVLTKGFDAPTATCCVIARPTKSLMLHVQMMGRVLRVSPDGKKALFLDHSGNMSRLGFPDDDFPDELDDGKKKDQAEKKQAEKEREEKAPKPCHQCGFLHNVFKCPQCGAERTVEHGVQEVQGELVKVKESAAARRNRNTPKEQKQAFYSACIGYALQKGFKPGWAANVYKERYGVYPNAMQKIPGASNTEFAQHLKYKNIRYAKSIGK